MVSLMAISNQEAGPDGHVEVHTRHAIEDVVLEQLGPIEDEEMLR